jgi:hypothetical protein
MHRTKGGLLMISKPILRRIPRILLALALIAFFEGIVYGAKKDKNSEKKPAITEAELQSHVMSFADRFAAVMVTSFDEFEAKQPPQKVRHEVLALVTYSMSNAYVIAGESDPDVALLDIVSMITLGRIILEEEGPTRYGQKVQPIIQGFRTAEKDIRDIAAVVLTPDQLADLMATIKRWRKENTGVIFFPPIRFSDFDADRRGSHLTRAEGQGGLFKSVEAATEQVEEMRLLAERGMYLATRMPQMSGLFAELWLTRLLENPHTAKVLTDVSTLSAATDRLAAAAEKLPDQIAVERNATIRQAVKSIAQERNSAVNQIAATLSAERKAALDAFASEEGRIRALLADLRQTLATGNEFVGSVNALATQFKSNIPSEPAKPFDIRDYRMTLAELSSSAKELTKLAASLERVSDKVGADKLIPHIVNALDRAESEGEELINHAMLQMILLIVIGLIGYIIARLFIQYISTKMMASAK